MIPPSRRFSELPYKDFLSLIVEDFSGIPFHFIIGLLGVCHDLAEVAC